MTEKERELMDRIFNPYGLPLKQGEPTDVDEDWERIENECSEKSWHHFFTPVGSEI